MIRIEHTIDIGASASQVYWQWTQYESYALFMENVEEVTEISTDILQWRARRHNEEVEWESEITAKVPQRMLAWRDLISESKESTVITIHEVDDTHCRVQVILHVELHAPPQRVAMSEVAIIEQVEADLARFKALLEHPEATPFDSGSPGLTGVEYGHHIDVSRRGLLTDTPGSPTVPTSKEMSKSPDADGKDNRIDLENSQIKTS